VNVAALGQRHLEQKASRQSSPTSRDSFFFVLTITAGGSFHVLLVNPARVLTSFFNRVIQQNGSIRGHASQIRRELSSSSLLFLFNGEIVLQTKLNKQRLFPQKKNKQRLGELHRQAAQRLHACTGINAN
jgi:hypothetical protein